MSTPVCASARYSSGKFTSIRRGPPGARGRCRAADHSEAYTRTLELLRELEEAVDRLAGHVTARADRGDDRLDALQFGDETRRVQDRPFNDR